MKQWAQAAAGLLGVGGDGARRKISGGTWETRRGGAPIESGDQRPGGINNLRNGPGRESDRLIVCAEQHVVQEG